MQASMEGHIKAGIMSLEIMLTPDTAPTTPFYFGAGTDLTWLFLK